jgi:alanine racemase
LDSLMPTRPCWVEIRTRSLEENYRFLMSLAAGQAELLAIVKADAYGHSLELCAPAVVRGGARWLGVTSVEEGVAARSLCLEARILVIGGVFPGQGRALVEHGLTPVAWELGQLDELESAAHASRVQAGGLLVHLEIDTGMSRQGTSPELLGSVLARLGPGSPLKLEGVMTHLFAADELDGAVTETQLDRLDQALNQIEAAGLNADWLNVGNSAALLSGEAARIAALAGRHGMKAMLRPGLALYGLAPKFEPEEPEGLAAARAALQPVLSWKTEVVGVRTVPAGAVVGYNGTGPLWPRSRCAWRSWPSVTATGSTAGLATTSACWFAASERPLWAASAWTRPCLT